MSEIFTYLLLLSLNLGPLSDSNNSNLLFNKFQYYKNKYKVECLNEKITDNFGNGYDSLYGTRNMRTILYGVAYRGGANNFYHKFHKRDNHNPLPEDGLTNLCSQGFSSAVYLYSTNFPESNVVYINTKAHDTMSYIQNSGIGNKKLKEIMLMVFDVINTPQKGPIYFHCWNGWHQSGYISAALLMQFCDFSNKHALDYWLENTDGVNKGYEKIKDLIKTFIPYNDIFINNKTKKEICPCFEK
jgi:hypothetical protein